jgi:hypothetical protein
MVVAVLMTSCQVSTLSKTRKVGAQAVGGRRGRFPRWLERIVVVGGLGGHLRNRVLDSTHTTDRQSRAILLKLDELIRIHSEARDEVIAVEGAPPAAQEQLEEQMTNHSQAPHQ